MLRCVNNWYKIVCKKEKSFKFALGFAIFDIDEY